MIPKSEEWLTVMALLALFASVQVIMIFFLLIGFLMDQIKYGRSGKL